MSTPILATKLYAPPTRPQLIARPRLIEQLNEGLRSGRKLTLVSASAGFGKTCAGYLLIHESFWDFTQRFRSGGNSFPAKLGSAYFQNTHWESLG